MNTRYSDSRFSICPTSLWGRISLQIALALISLLVASPGAFADTDTLSLDVSLSDFQSSTPNWGPVRNSYVDWRKDLYGRVHCAELTPSGDQIREVDTNVCRQQLGTQFEWRKDLYGRVFCAEITYGGDQLQQVDSNVCRQGAGPGRDRWGTTHVEWRSDLYGRTYCAEVTNQGDQVQQVDSNQCRHSLGTRDEWRRDLYGRTYCAEITPSGKEIQQQDKNICRQELGSYYEWKKDLYGRVFCAELTYGQGWQIEQVDMNYCR